MNKLTKMELGSIYSLKSDISRKLVDHEKNPKLKLLESDSKFFRATYKY